MTDESTPGAYRGSFGSISGFTSFDGVSDAPDLFKTGWSLEQLLALLGNQSGLNFPSNERMTAIEEEILAHAQDYNNPHHTTLDQIAKNFIPQVLANIVAGTVPPAPPFASYYASTPLPFGTIFPGTYTDTNIYRRVAGGRLIDTGTERSVMGSSTQIGRPGLPLFNSFSNVVPDTWSDVSNCVNTTIAESESQPAGYPFTFYDVTETPTTGQFGFDIQMGQAGLTVYTTTFYVRREATGGSIRVFQPSNISEFVDISLEDGSYTTYSSNITAVVARYSDTTMLVSITYTSTSPDPDNALRLIHINHGDSGSGQREGSLGRKLFAIANPQAATTHPNAPQLVDRMAPGGAGTFSFDMEKLSAPSQLENFIVSIKAMMYPMPALAAINDTTIFSMGDFVISRNDTTVTVSVAGDIVTTFPIKEGFNAFTISYSPTTVIFKNLLDDRVTFTGDYPPIAVAQNKFGPFGGYLLSAVLYGYSDAFHAVEFLTDG